MKVDPDFEQMTTAQLEAFLHDNDAEVAALRAQNERAHSVLEVVQASEFKAAQARRGPDQPPSTTLSLGALNLGHLQTSDLQAMKQRLEEELSKRS